MTDIFCQIIKKKKPAFIIYEDKEIMAFLDIEPVSRGHTLIVPKNHSTELENTNPKILKKIIRLTCQFAKILKKTFNYDGVVFICNSGKKLQDIKHLHFHIYGKNKGEKRYYYQEFKNDKTKSKTLKRDAILIKEKLSNSD